MPVDLQESKVHFVLPIADGGRGIPRRAGVPGAVPGLESPSSDGEVRPKVGQQESTATSVDRGGLAGTAWDGDLR